MHLFLNAKRLQQRFELLSEIFTSVTPRHPIAVLKSEVECKREIMIILYEIKNGPANVTILKVSDGYAKE